MHKLYYDPASPYSRKVRILCRELGIQVIEIISDPWGSPGLPQGINPLAKIPVLELPSGACLFDSRVIANYFLNLSGTLGAPYDSARDRHQSLCSGILDALLTVRQQRRFYSAKQASFSLLERQWSAVRAGLDDLARYPPAHDGAFEIEAICLVTVIDYVRFRFHDEPAIPLPESLAVWRDYLPQRRSIIETAPYDITIR